MSAIIGGLTLMCLAVFTQNFSRPVISLWPKGNPDGWHRADTESSDHNPDLLIIKGVSSPTLEVFRSKSAKPDAPTVLILPGGGYSIEAIEHEGWEVAQRLNLAGIHAAVLKYRLPNREEDKPLHKVVVQDAQRALRVLRSRAKEFGTTSGKVGMLGFSAGAHASAATSTASGSTYEAQDEADTLSARPDFTVLISPAYLDKKGAMELSDGLNVDAQTPPVFIAQTMDDPLQIEGALAYTHACHLAKVPVELHLFPKGGHGYGLRTHEPGIKDWPDLLVAWLNRL